MKKNAGKLIRSVFATLFISVVSYSQGLCQIPFYRLQPNHARLIAAPLPDTLARQRFGRSVLLWSAAQVLPWSFDKYILKADYANISFKTVGYNLTPRSWTWDGDGFVTNQLSHPSHGSIFFNAFRANGYSFWQSVPAAFAGSYFWETFAEKQYPSPNDFINSGFGGVVLGEMTNRLANKLINNRRQGFRRQAGEVAAMIINPANGITRILDGRWGKISTNSAQRDSSKIYAEFDIGIRKYKVNNLDGDFGLYGHAKLLYGTPYENYKIPFSNISINAEFGRDDSSSVNIVSVYGSLAGWRVRSTESSHHLAVLSANYDFIYNEAFFYSAQSVKLNLFSAFGLTRRLKVNTVAGIGPVILAAVPDVYSYKGRYYDYCTGVGFNSSINISMSNRFFYSISYRGGWLKTIDGNASYYFLHAISSEGSYRIIKGFSICAEPGYFILRGYYKQFDNVGKTYPYIRISVRYSVNMQ